MAEEEALEALRKLSQARGDVVHELAGVWNVLSNSIFLLRRQVGDQPQLASLVDEMARADERGRALFDSLRRLI